MSMHCFGRLPEFPPGTVFQKKDGSKWLVGGFGSLVKLNAQGECSFYDWLVAQPREATARFQLSSGSYQERCAKFLEECEGYYPAPSRRSSPECLPTTPATGSTGGSSTTPTL